jgi:hypothetical protein
MDGGPVEYMLVAFPGNRFTGEIGPAMQQLIDDRMIRVIDLAFVVKRPDGAVATFELADLAPDVQAALAGLGKRPDRLVSDEDLYAAAQELEPDSSAALVVWEDLWAARLAESLRKADGRIIELQRVPHADVTEARRWLLVDH